MGKQASESLREKDPMGTRMKIYELAEAGRKATPLLPLLARLDGKCFSGWTRGLARPYDERLSNIMVDLTRHLLEETSASCGYTQSDEVTLGWYTDNPKTQLYFDGRYQKITSVLAATASVWFNTLVPQHLPEKAGKLAVFDCRAWAVPTLDEAANVFLWREFDATKNSIAMAAQHYYSHKELLNKHSGQMQEMLWQKGVNWNAYPRFFKRGTYVQRKPVKRKFTAAELELLPPKHAARQNPDLEVERSEYTVLDMPVFSTVTNRAGVLFRAEEPVTRGE